jgi:2-desacetyl-2-hydroxyethyl bacteriochlorophyllide A dehydrogenase
LRRNKKIPMMKCIVCKEPGKFEMQEIIRPELTEGNAIIKIKRIGICGTDFHAYNGTQPYFTYPRILGHELSGEIAEIELSIQDFSIGDNITIIPYYPCGECIACRRSKPNCCENIKGAGVHIDGGMVEYLSVPVHSLIQGRGLGYEELAMVETLAIGAHAVRISEIEPDEFVLVTGCGPIGMGVMEFSRIAGAKVIAMDIIKERLNFCRDVLGIDFLVDAAESPAKKLKEITNGDWPTIVIDATGNANAIVKGFEYLAHGGRYVMVGIQKEDICFNHPEFHKRETTLMSSRNATREDFEHVISSMKKGLVKARSYITHTVSFDKMIDEFKVWIKPDSGVIKAMVKL